MKTKSVYIIITIALLISAKSVFAAGNIKTITVSNQIGSLTAGTPGSVTYNVNVNLLKYSITTLIPKVTGLPSGATWVFNPSSITTNKSTNFTLTIKTSSSTPVGIKNFDINIANTIKSAILTINSNIPTGNNLILNPSVEDQTNGQPNNWLEGSWGSNTNVFNYPVQGINATSAIQVSITNYPSGGGDAKWYFTPVNVTANQFYTFSDKYKSDITSYVVAEFHNSNGSLSYQQIGIANPSNNWNSFSTGFTVPNGVTSLTIFHLISSVGTLTTDDYSLFQTINQNSFSQGMVSLSFDDGWSSIYTNAMPILNAANIKSTQYIITDEIDDTANGYMSKNDILNMSNQGHDIQAHTKTHSDLTTLNSTNLNNELLGSLNALLALPINSVNNMAYPYGQYNSSVKLAVKNNGYKGARTVNMGYNDKTTDPFELYGTSVQRGGNCDGGTSATDINSVKSWIDSAVQNKTWLILVFHQVDNVPANCYGISPSMLQSIVDYIKTNNVSTVTVNQGLQAMGL